MTKRWRVLFLSFLLMITLIGISVTSYADEINGTEDVPVTTAAEADGWVDNVDGTYSYRQNGSLVESDIIYVGGCYYAFNWNGIMYADEEFDLYVDQWNYYRAKADGSLYVNEWYYDDYSETWYYYGAGGAAPEGYTQVGGVYYYFEYRGRMADEGLYYDVYDNVYTYYAVDENGHAYPVNAYKGWEQVNGKWYYGVDGELCRQEVIKIRGQYYGFAWDGTMYTEGEFGASDANGNWKYYRVASSSGELYTNKWYGEKSEYDEDVTYWYYYGADAAGYEGLQTVGGVTYYFYGDGRMATNDYIEWDGTTYVIGSDGTVVQLNPNGWTQVGDDWFYAVDGELYEYEIVQINGKYYAFEYSGKVYRDEMFWFYDNDTEQSHRYAAKADGSLIVNDWYKNDDGDWCYFGADGKGADGIQVIKGVTYGFYDGYMYDDCTFYLWDDDGNYAEYRAKKGGALYINCWYRDSYESWQYYDANGQRVEGIQTIEGVTYGFDGYYLANDSVVEDDGSFYYADADGIIVKKPGFYKAKGYYVYIEDNSGKLKEGWHQGAGKEWYYLDPIMLSNTAFVEDGVCYYVNNAGVCKETSPNGFFEEVYIENGVLLKNTWKMINGSWYYFYEDGFYARGLAQINDTWYYFDQAGVLKTGGWVQSSYGTWYYADGNGALATGLKTIGGSQYYFGPDMRTDVIVSEDGKSYLIGSDGIVQATASGTGWKSIGGYWYYSVNGEFLCGTGYTIDGIRYGFDFYGRMVTNEVFNSRYYGADGKPVSGWIKSGNRWMYADANNSNILYNYGEYTIGGVDYVFYDYETLLGTFEFDGYIYTTDKNGAVQSKLEKAAGWFVAGGTYYYWPGGDRNFTGWVGNYYIEYGVMLRDGIRYIENSKGAYVPYYFDAYGVCQTGRWIPYGRTYLLAKADGQLYANEWLKSGSTWYYFLDDGRMAYYDMMIDGQPHSFAKNGRWLGQIVSGSEGWAKGTDGSWYYYHAGHPVTGERCIDGKYYYFNSMGAMVADTFEYDYDFGNAYYYDINGIRAEYVGWKKIDGRWVYFSDNHTIITGWIEVDGKTYYQSMYGVLTGILDIDYQFHKFAEDGTYLGVVEVTDGWYKFYDEWYYFIDGEFADGRIQVGSNWYYFEYGRMMTDAWYRDYNYHEGNNGYYFGKDGVQRTATGWFKNGDGEWMYIDSYGRLVTGVHTIGGKVYYFSDYVWVG